MLSKNDQRLRRSKQTRTRIALQRVARLTVHRTNLHIYANLISDDGSRVLASASTGGASLYGTLAATGAGLALGSGAVVAARLAGCGSSLAGCVRSCTGVSGTDCTDATTDSIVGSSASLEVR